MTMNRKAIGRLSLFLMLGFSAAAWAKSEIAHVSQREVSSLEKEFNAATVPSTEKIMNKTWTCEMHGLQTRMQRAHGKKLYKFLKDDLKNSGSMPIEQYEKKDSGLVGTRGPLQDEIRAKKNGQLIAKLSVKDRPLSFAVCN